MLMVEAALRSYAVEATDGRIGTVRDCLLDESNWKLRWLIVDTGTWLSGRKILIHPSAVGRPDIALSRLPVSLAKAQIEASPEFSHDAPVSERMEDSLYDYYGWDPAWGGVGTFTGCWAAEYGEAAILDRRRSEYATCLEGSDPELRSMAALKGYHVRASNGAIGHVENFIIDDAGWDTRYLVVDTRNWLFGQQVLISPFAIRSISRSDQEIRLDVARERVKNSPPWKPLDLIDQCYQERLHRHYAWPGYGW